MVWKIAPANAFGWGGLLVHRLSTGQEFDIDPIEMHTDTDLSFNNASLGERFVAAHDSNHNLLYIYDLDTRQPVLIEDLGEDRNEGEREAVVGRPHIDGSLRAYIQGSDEPSMDLALKYVQLPAPRAARTRISGSLFGIGRVPSFVPSSRSEPTGAGRSPP